MIKKITRHKVELKNTSPIDMTPKESDVFIKLEEADTFSIPATSVSGVFRNYIKTISDVDKITRGAVLCAVFQDMDLLLEALEKEKFKRIAFAMSEILKNHPLIKFQDMTLRYKSFDTLKRNHVFIERKTKAAKDGALFTETLLAVGTVFDFQVETLQWHDDEPIFGDKITEILNDHISEDRFNKRFRKLVGYAETDNLEEIKREEINTLLMGLTIEGNPFEPKRLYEAVNELFKSFLVALDSNVISFTGKSTLGYGQFAIDFYGEKSYDVTTVNERNDYIDEKYDDVLKTGNQWEVCKEQYTSKRSLVKKVCFKVNCKTGFFINSGIKSDKIQQFFSESHKKNSVQNHVILPSSTIKGMIRSHMEKIARTIDQFDAQSTHSEFNKVLEIFGYTEVYLDEHSSDKNQENPNKKGELVFGDVVLEGAAVESYTEHIKHAIKIDRFTGGAFTGGLRTYKWIKPHKPFTITFSYFTNSIYANDIERYMGYLENDLRDGFVTVGALTSIGAGVLEGEKIDE